MKNSFNLENIVRENIKKLEPYSCARNEFKGNASILLDANENPYGSPSDNFYNRYPDPLQNDLKEKLSKLKGVPVSNIFLGNGSDEAIDITFRIFCEPGVDNVILFPPTYGMYKVAASINNVEYKQVSLIKNYQLDLERLNSEINQHTKLIFICSPNNPTGNNFKRQDILSILSNFNGLVILDEAYIDFSSQSSLLNKLIEFPNLIVLQTLSKAWGLAGLRLGVAYASPEIISFFNKIKAPYNINQATQTIALTSLNEETQVRQWVKEIVSERERVSIILKEITEVWYVYPSDANFILIKLKNASALYQYLTEKGIVVRDRSMVELCENCLRVSIGTPEQNNTLLHSVLTFYRS
jgi:histidinol-phosphate aminotransferase